MFLVVGIICAVICGMIASSKGRNIVGWAVLGFLFGIFSLIIVACLPNLKEQQQKERYIAEENRRLREQLRQEQIKGEAFRQHAAARLDAHDQHLNLDTRALGQSLPAGAADTPQLASGDDISVGWYYDRGGNICGPISQVQIFELIRQNQIRRDTMVWAEHLTEWQIAGSTEPFQAEFRG
ncbi:MAG: DUF4339 domain-containing protein [Phycisphaerales bacterium]|nr:DUF4339 domain-containing protein [Phycisphaerales bacterium]